MKVFIVVHSATEMFNILVLTRQRYKCYGTCSVGTSRGEAEGFALDILSKLRDVKSKVSRCCSAVELTSFVTATFTICLVVGISHTLL